MLAGFRASLPSAVLAATLLRDAGAASARPQPASSIERILSVASLLVVSTTNREPANYVLRMLAAGSLLAALVQPEAAECGGTKRKKGTVVKEFYEVDCMKARRIVKGGAIEYLIHWKGYEDKDDTWEPLSDKPFWHGAGSLGL